MLVRIWWKEGRALAPIALTLAVALGGVQWFLLAYGGRDVPRGVLIPLALGWATLYALVAGAASFAGERELRMMGFLDALPVGRGVLWLGKVSFALGSTFLLGVAFRTVGAIGEGWGTSWDQLTSDALLTPARTDRFSGLLLAEAAVWGIFWSAISKNALSAGILAVITTAISATIASFPILVLPNQAATSDGSGVVLGGLSMMAVLLLASWVIVRWDQAGWGFQPRQPAGPPPVAATEKGDSWAFRPIQLDPAFRSVAWQTAREGRSSWLLATGIVLAIPGGELILFGPSPASSGTLMVLTVLSLLIAGTSVFGLEGAAGTRPFLDDQAVPPPIVWAAKVATWLGGLAVSAALLVGSSALVGHRGALAEAARGERNLATFLMIGANGFAVGLLGGMVFARRITAVLLSGIAAGVVMAPQAALFGYEMIPAWSLALAPAILVAISFLWAGDWLAVRGDWRRWARLATLMTVSTVGLGCWYIAGRAWGIPDIGPQFLTTTRPAPAAGNLNEEYRLAARRLVTSEQFDAAKQALPVLVDRGWGRASPEVVAAWQAGRAAIESARGLAARPGAIACADRPVLDSGPIFPDREDRALFASLDDLSSLLTLDGVERRSRGDRIGAWEDILAQYRMSNQAAAGASTLLDYGSAMRLSEAALRPALAWARDPALTREEIQAARQSLQQLPLPSMVEVLRAESGRLEAALALPTDIWLDGLTAERVGGGGGEGLGPALQRIAYAWFVVPTWERERTRRILRQVTRTAVEQAGNDWYERGGSEPFWPPGSAGTTPALNGTSEPGTDPATPLARAAVLRHLVGAEGVFLRELANRRALDTILAVRSWQVDHDGQAPAALDPLVPSEIGSIPVDPFAPMREPLGYVRAGAVRDGKVFPDEPGPYCCLISVGLDGRREPGPLKIPGPGGDLVEPGGDDLRYVLPASIPPRAASP